MKTLGIKKSIVMRLVLATVSWVFLFSASAVNASSVQSDAYANECLSPDNKMASGTVKDLMETMKGLPTDVSEEQLTATLDKLVADGKYVKNGDVYSRKGAVSTTGVINGKMVVGDEAKVRAEVAKLNAEVNKADKADTREVVAAVIKDAMEKLGLDTTGVEEAVNEVMTSRELALKLEKAIEAGFVFADLSDMDTAAFVSDAKDAKDTLALVVAEDENGNALETPVIALMNKANANEKFDAAKMIEEILKVDALKNGATVEDAYKVSSKALYEAQAAVYSVSIASAIRHIQEMKMSKEKVSQALNLVVDQYNDGVADNVNAALVSAFDELALGLDGEKDVDLLKTLHGVVADADASLAGAEAVNDKINLMVKDGKTVVSNTTVVAINAQEIYIDKATYDAMRNSRSRTAQAYASVFERAGKVIRSMADYTNNKDDMKALVLSPENQELISVASANKNLKLDFVAAENVQSMELMDLALLTGQDAQVRKIFFQQLDPQVQLIYASVYGESLMDVINGKFSDKAYEDVDLGTVALQIQIRSEVAAAIKA